ncbi:MAG: hypothetical protein KDD58_13615 [Bdellovibrionales bacterium]|nr:hypothetical protein [Bdellovibrionales bacterium]
MSVNIILDNLSCPESIYLSDLRHTLLNLKNEEKVSCILKSSSGFVVSCEIPHPERCSENVFRSWLRYYLCAVYARALALGNPDESISYSFENELCDNESVLRSTQFELEKYFADFKYSLTSKAAPTKSEIKIVSQQTYEKFERHSPQVLLNFNEIKKTMNIIGDKFNGLKRLEDPIVLGIDQGARGVSVAVFKGNKNITCDVLGEDNKELYNTDQSYHYQYTFPYGSRGGSGEEFANRLIGFIKKVIEKTQNKVGHVRSIFVGLPGVKSANEQWVSFGMIAREFGSPGSESYKNHIGKANLLISDFKKQLLNKGIVVTFQNDMMAWAYSIIAGGYTNAIAIVAGGGQGQIAIKNNVPVNGHNEGGHQACFPLFENGFSFNSSSPPGSFESVGLSNPGIRYYWLKKSGLENEIRKEFKIPEEKPIEVLHLGNLLVGLEPSGNKKLSDSQRNIQERVRKEIWENVANVEAEHILFLYDYCGGEQYIFAGGPVSGKTGEVFVSLLKEKIMEKSIKESLDVSRIKISLIESGKPAERAALTALKIYESIFDLN